MADEPINGAVVDAVIDTQDDVDELAEQLRSLESVDSQILEKVESCQNQMESLLTRLAAEPTESPVLMQILRELTELRSEVVTLKATVDSLNLKQSELPATHVLMVEPAPVALPEVAVPLPTPEPEPRRKKRQIL